MLNTRVKLDIKALEEYGDELLDKIEEGLDDNVDRGFQRSQELITKQSFDRGILLQSGHVIKEDELKRIISYEALHAFYVEYGATYTTKMPPLQVIYEWVRRHQLTPKNPDSLVGIKRWLKKQGIIKSLKSKDSDYWAIAYFIAKDIKEHGLEPRPFMRPAVEEMKAHIVEDVEKRIKTIGR